MTTYPITGMNCNGCVKRITEAVKDFAGTVTLSPPQLTVPKAQDPGFEKLSEAVHAAGAGKYKLLPESAAAPVVEKSWFKTYYPLLLIIAFISVVSLAGSDIWQEWMMHFMAGFFLVFSFFKLLDVRGFADGYAGYDLLAAKWRPYGFIYPFIELALGLAYLFEIQTKLALICTIIVMGFSSLGVIKSVRNKQKIRCACLGNTLNLPMSVVTIVEDVGMVLMALVMLWYYL